MDKNKMIYLDYETTTPVDKKALDAMLPYFNQNFGNPASLHNFGQEAKKALESAREKVANLINANSSSEVIFTGSATESNNLALKGVAFANKNKGKHIITTSMEHACVKETAKWLKEHDFEITFLPVDKYGMIDLKDLKKNIKKDTILISVIHGSNEIGTIQPIKEIGDVCKQKNIYFHTDAVQSFGKEEIDVEGMNIDLLSASSHKMYGPKGVACLYIRNGVKIEPIIHGGGQEFGYRSSTSNVAGIVGFAEACRIAEKEGDKDAKRIKKLRDKLIKGISENIEGAYLNGHPEKRLANNVNFRFKGLEGESILFRLDMNNIAVSTGSACSSNKLEPSSCLLATGLKPEEVHGSIRFSLGRYTTEEEIDYVLETLPKVIKDLRKISPF